MTKRDSFIKKDLFMNILMWLEDWDGRVPMPAVLKPEPLWTGKQVVNLIIPRVNLRRKAAWAKDQEDQDMTPWDSQVHPSSASGFMYAPCFTWCVGLFRCVCSNSEMFASMPGHAHPGLT